MLPETSTTYMTVAVSPWPSAAVAPAETGVPSQTGSLPVSRLS